MKIAVLGSSGYIGRNLIQHLLEQTDHTIVALSPNATSLEIDHDRFHAHNVDVFDTETLTEHMRSCDAAYYLIHMMALQHVDFANMESKAAESFGTAAKAAILLKVIFLGGLGNDNDQLSKHLASRHHTGEILRQYVPQVIEFRASMVIGDGSVSYDIIAHLVHKLPILTLPKWSTTLTQPIGLSDALKYLIAALSLKQTSHEIIEIGGPQPLSYGDLMKRYANWKGKKAFFIRIPFIPVSIAAWWLNIFTPKRHAKVGRVMVESLANPMIVTNSRAQELFPDVVPRPLEDVFV